MMSLAARRAAAHAPARIAARARVAPLARFTAPSRSVATSAPRDAPAPPPPPPGAPPGGGMRKLLVAIIAASAGAVYFENDLRKLMGLPPSEDGGIMGMATGGKPGKAAKAAETDVAELKAEVERMGSKLAQEIEHESRDAAEKAKAAVATKAAAAAATGQTPASSPAAAPPTQPTPKQPVDYAAVREAIRSVLEDENHDDGSYGPVFVRLAWHNAGTYDKRTGKGGSEGALMRYNKEGGWGANAGLDKARARLEPVKTKFPGITYSDLWSLAGTVAIEEMGGPDLSSWRPGRKDRDEGDFDLPDGLLPDADGRDHRNAPADHLRDIFGRMGFDDKEIVCLSGAHALGRCHTAASGYEGPWTRAPTTVSNEYFRLLLEEDWTKKTTHEGEPWTGPEQFEDRSRELMMLPTDLALVQDAKMRPIVEAYAQDEDAFVRDFGKAWMKLQELGVRKFHGRRRYWLFGPRE